VVSLRTGVVWCGLVWSGVVWSDLHTLLSFDPMGSHLLQHRTIACPNPPAVVPRLNTGGGTALTLPCRPDDAPADT
jgi:hypothetical protein